ncbi:ABC transporter ATP-binding protein/permease [Taklimakanibacter lacteus]|uniref:ABC transporter ATP-binding protein/permease n=1 Tax=Taklimakanibacter lacteus TaxID=2268456 RepID=UPI000E675E9E
MTDQSTKLADAASDIDEAAQAGLVKQLSMMIGALFASPVRNTLLLLGFALVAVILVTAYGQIRLNSWNQPFYDALARRDLPDFLTQLGVFGLIAGSLLILNVFQTFLNQMIKLKLREGLVRDLIGQWLLPRRAFRLANAGPIGVNPDQRLHEDARHLTELSADLGIGLFQSAILLASFIGVLWTLSSGFIFNVGGRSFDIPGYMVWAAIIYSGSASLVSYWVGRPLIERNAERYAREADLRFSMMRVNEHIDAVALFGGEADEKRRIEVDLYAALAATRSIINRTVGLTWVTAGYGWLTIVAPILVAAPVYFAGNLSFGGLMMAVGAFNQVQNSLRWFIDNFSAIADWRATLLRIASFRSAVMKTDILHDVESRIDFVEGKPGEVRLDKLEIASPTGCTMLKETKVEIKAGERVLIVGDSGSGKTLLFRTLAGLWPWGDGRIAWPKGETILYMPRTPYMPPGTLREVMAYPAVVKGFAEAEFPAALKSAGLDNLIGKLDMQKRWDKKLSDDEQQALAFARVRLHKPQWLLIDEVLDSMEDSTYERVVAMLAQDLKQTGVIHIGKAEAHDHVFERVLHLVKDPCTRNLAPRKPMPDIRPKPRYAVAAT